MVRPNFHQFWDIGFVMYEMNYYHNNTVYVIRCLNHTKPNVSKRIVVSASLRS
jgi:hypothetical protein